MTVLGVETYVFAGSSHLSRGEYDASSKTLTITFQDGRSYQAQDVPADAYERLTHARSAGSHFHTFLQDAYDWEEV